MRPFGGMPAYRVYSLDPAGRIMSAAWVEADDDEGALQAARAQGDAGAPALEVWRGNRRIAVIPHAPDASP